MYAGRLGWRVLPLNGKIPLLKAWQREASSDPGTIADWQDQYPNANVGILTGDKFFVLDVDVKNGGTDTLADLEAEHGDLPRTVQARTGSGGSHYLFKLPDFPVSNSAGKVGPGLDIRGTGGQIVVAPSVTEAGRYTWVNAPWDVEIADAPAWLLELIRQRPDAEPAPVVRPTFPPASAEVLDAARRSLDVHGPAIQGNGGDDHTFVAAALLVHDFALTDAEAWPLFVDWNDDCNPPWSESDLRSKLRGGSAYGKLPYGCRRTMDVVQTARMLISQWQQSGSIDATVLSPKLRVLALDDVTARAVVEQEWHAATGLAGRSLGLPRPKAPVIDVPRGTILVNTELAVVADAATKAIAARVFSRNGVLCEVAKQERIFIHDLERAGLVDLMSQSTTFIRNDPKQGTVTIAPPDPVAAILQARRNHAGVRVIEAVTASPIFLPDGTILEEEGYNEQARVYLTPSVTVSVPSEPTLADAHAAVAVFRDLLCDFKFASEADFSSWLSALLTPLVKAATGNAPAPLTCISASSPGIGKTLLTKTIAHIVTGDDPEIRPYNPRDPAEWGKRLTAFVKAASPVNVFDNCNGPIGDDALDRLITASTWSDRQLGATEAPPLPVVSTWLATGNNIEPVGDTVRRVLMVRLDVMDERPQERTGFKYDLEGGHAKEHRADLLTAALTLLRAYHCAGRPDQALASWGSFKTWSALVRGAIVWAGLADPFLTQQRASEELNEPENQAHDFWLEIVAASDGSAAEIVKLANARDAQGVLGLRESLSQHHLKRFLGRFVDKPRAGQRIRRVRADDVTRYEVEEIG